MRNASGSDPERLTGPGVRWPRALVVGLAALLPLVVVPGLGQPFSTPKVVLLGAVVTAGALLAGRRLLAGWRGLPVEFRIALVAWIGTVGASAAFGAFVAPLALLLPLFAAGWFLLVVSVRPRAEELALALVVSGAAVACVALLQFAGADPFALGGWTPAGEPGGRLRVYATLGNPNFVAALLVGVTPLTFFLRNRFQSNAWLLWLVLAAQMGALLATDSRAVLPGLGCCLLWLVGVERPRRWQAFAAIAALVGVVAVAAAPSRPLTTTLRGRWYIWRTAAPHVSERALFGWGPGGFAAKYPEWETMRWASQPPSTADRAFSGLQDHAHNDYLEILVEYGAAGLLAFLALVLGFLRFAYREARATGDELLIGASASAVALAGVALVDFPFTRPAELFLFWSLLAVAYLVAGEACARESLPLGGRG